MTDYLLKIKAKLNCYPKKTHLVIDFGYDSPLRNEIADLYKDSGNGNFKGWSERPDKGCNFEYLVFQLDNSGRLFMFYSYELKSSLKALQKYHDANKSATLINCDDLFGEEKKYAKKKLEL